LELQRHQRLHLAFEAGAEVAQQVSMLSLKWANVFVIPRWNDTG